jgi:membrane-associated phospholipid phosphatase
MKKDKRRMNANPVFRRWIVAAAATLVATLLCVAYVDRPLAEFFELNVRHTHAWIVVRAAAAPLGLVPVSAMLFLFACGAWVLSGRRLSSSTRIPLLCSWATMWAIGVETILKRIFGRGWVDPTYVQEHLYGFHLLHGDKEHWNSFPSGTALGSAAIAAVLWIMLPSSRVAVVVLLLILSATMVVINFHWLGDTLPGLFLGSFIGWVTVRMPSSAE